MILAPHTTENTGMIDLQVSEGYAFDYFAIMQVKAQKTESEINIRNYHLCFNNLRAEVGPKLFDLIVSSQEYKDLVNVNAKTFDAVDKAKTDEIPASLVDRLNYERYLKKCALQEKFFDSKMDEQKIGYNSNQ